MKFYTGTKSIIEPTHIFSNGTEAEGWYYSNCGECVKAFLPKGDYPSEKTMQEYVRCGKYCKLQYWLDIGFAEGVIPKEIAEQIGLKYFNVQVPPAPAGIFAGLKDTCMFFSDNDNDRYKPPKRPKPDVPNQLCMPLSDLFQESEVLKESELTEILQHTKPFEVIVKTTP